MKTCPRCGKPVHPMRRYPGRDEGILIPEDRWECSCGWSEVMV